MKKIITAINNPKLNEELKKENNFKIIGKDIQYKEAILEILEKNDNIDLIIISENIPGEIKFEKLIEKIKIKNEKIKIIFILEKENNDLEKILIKNNIKDIYYNNKINLNELIKIINKKEMNMEEEIIKLKKIIEEKNIKKEKECIKKIKKVEKQIKDFIIMELKKYKKKDRKEMNRSTRICNMSTKVITFSGNNKSGKSTLSLIISHCLAEKNKKILLIDADLEKQDLSIILKQENKLKNKSCDFFLKNKFQKRNFKNNRKNFFINRINYKNKFKNSKIEVLKLNRNYKKTLYSKNKIYYYKLETIIKNNIKKINHNLYFFNKLNNINMKKILKKEEILKKIINLFFKIIKENYDVIIIDLSKNSECVINKQILKNSYTNFVLLEPNLLGVKEIQKLLNQYLLEWKITKNSLFVIESKKNFISINKKLILKSIPVKNKIFEIKENRFYCILLNHYYKRKILIKNKTIKKDLNKIINKILIK